MSNSGAKAALKGYRLQTLFILDEILNVNDKDIIFQPEGNEDLAVYHNDKLIRAVQIKAKNEPLTLSSFSPEKKDSFFHRVVDLLSEDESVIIEVISFGQIGQEIKKAWAGEKASKLKIQSKLAKFDITNSQTELLLKQVRWQEVSETQINQRLCDRLNQTLTAGLPEHAFSLLVSWLYIASEHQTKISHQNLVEKISATGKYLAERAAHHNEWFKSIQPLLDISLSDKGQLAQEYYRGVSTRFSHIQANLDTYRTDQLNALDELLRNNRTVIIHGASGQGKTSLAYRYLYDYVPEDWRLQINFVDSRVHAQSVALAIADHLAAFDAKLYLYIDVSPRDLDWTTLVKSLLDRSNIKILISIREEDLARQNISNEELGMPVALPLRFGKVEAENIYLNFVDKGVANAYPSFQQAWLSFGGDGSLLEYVYFLTQTESLKEKLSFQVKRLRAEVRSGKLEDQALALLLSCAIATAYEARINIGQIVKMVGLDDPAGTFEMFEDEYLIRRSADKQHVEALHPIRSRVLISILTDTVFSPWIDSAVSVLHCLAEADLETFLLYSFAEQPKEFTALFTQLLALEVKTWAGAAGICRALLWHGINNYVIENASIIQSARQFSGISGWKFMLSPDLAGALDDDPMEGVIEILAKNNPDALIKVKGMKKKMTPKEPIYEHVKHWLTDFKGQIEKPVSDFGWVSMGEVLFWVGWYKVTTKIDVSWLSTLEVADNFSNIEPLAELLLGTYYFDYDLYQQFISKKNDEIEVLFQKTTKTLWLEHQPHNPIAHYIVGVSDSSDESENSLNDLSGNRAVLLRKLYPENEKFGAKGYGHQVAFMELPLDESIKTSILKTAIPIPQLVHINTTWANYADYINRPSDWAEYISKILCVRKQFVKGLSTLIKALDTYFSKKVSRSLIDWKIESGYWHNLSRLNMQLPMLPKPAVDPWGYTSEGNERPDDEEQVRQQSVNVLAIQAHYDSYRKVLDNYVSSITNFFGQSHTILGINGLIGRVTKARRQAILQNVIDKEINYSEHQIHLSVCNFNDACRHLNGFQQAFRAHFSELVDIAELERLEIQERERLDEAWPLWYQFAHHPEKYWKSSAVRNTAVIAKNTELKLFDSIEKSLAELCSTDFTAGILSRSYEYNGKPAMWIIADLHEVSALDDFFEDIVDALSSAIGPLEYKDLKFFIMENAWFNFVIIPRINSGLISNLSWVILSSSFVGEEPVIDEDKPWLYPRVIEQQAICHFYLTTSTPSSFDDFSTLEKKLDLIFKTVNHMQCFCELLPDLNETGKEILHKHIEPFMADLMVNINDARSCIERLKADSNNLCINQEFIEVLGICHDAVLPFDELEENKTLIQLENCKEWAMLLHNITTTFRMRMWEMLFQDRE